MAKGWLRMAIVCLCASLLTGCWDRRELEERTSVLAIAIDMAEGQKDLYRLTVQIPIPIKIAGSSGQGGGGNADAVKIMSVTGRTILDANNNLQLRLNQKLFLGHTRVLAVSEEVAKKGISDIMDSFRREPQIRRLMWPIVVKGEAATLLKIKPQLAQIPVVFLMDLIENGVKMGAIPDQTLGDYFNQTSNKSMQPFLNYVQASATEVRWRGVAVFREHKMVGTLNDVQSWSLLQLRNEDRGGDVVIPLPNTDNGYVTFRPHFVKTRLELTEKSKGGNKNNEAFAAMFYCELQGDIVEVTANTKVSPEKFIQDMQRLIKKEMEERAKKLFYQLQKEDNSDILKLGLALRAHHYRDYWEKHDWHKDFKNFPIGVDYTIKVRRLGMEMQ
ncbi:MULTISPECIES: Ger(x)C family spore germination protein [Brevibacillus]|jgi:germination protein, Ger(x)C family|uniref:Spore germination protein YndF n=1 Tax=Brevibacillus parabrevis TaxID=54914 RepID=A0A4Y3PJB7_BREPA|nr:MULTISPECIES: Ger(x)C family spore germination protein [Brevibacillus]MDH6348568.1 spore germination protein KC [Brevibacillus sp. 1238]NRQ53075.1 Ger(x)C family spore germination protein [Brevibacillus sp. HD1.4A]MBU8713047.1 Ger(x)C family spore germination protein [Brevibacillus parabrevis]MDR5002285.1 Ger(x)C family spore germination protein [Brevibacillus parabrevis]RNB96895.1 Ger(x)C family spore germination protein [Brevibacillus parabrevis]